MTQGELEGLLRFFKVMSDETRLKIIGLLSRRPHNVGELAQALDLTEPTVSHHLAKLREMGLLTLNAVGTTRIYSVNKDMLRRFTALVFRLEEITQVTVEEKPDMAWIEALDLNDEDRKVFKDYFYGTRLKQIPTKLRKLRVILDWLVTKFEPGATYTEAQINAIIAEVHPDFASLRRALIEAHLLEREPGGKVYWRAEHSG